MSENSIQNGAINFENISKVKNVSVALYAELGKTKLSLKDIIEYDEGSVITLDKLADEPVDIFVDDILIAKAKIVALEDSYGVKIVEIAKNKNQEDLKNGEND